MSIALHITSVERIRYLLPFTDNELNGLLNFMARQIGLGDCSLELSLLDDAAMAELHLATMGTKSTTNILSFPLLYDTFAPYGAEEYQDKPPHAASAHGPSFHMLPTAFGASPAFAACTVTGDKAFPPLPVLGSLAMAVETVRREAFLYGQKTDGYSVFLLTHGVAHLLGYDHGPAMDSLMERMGRGALEALRIGM